MINPRVLTTIDLITKNVNSKVTRIIELGCGDGSTVREVANALGAVEVYGVDVNEEVLKKAEDRGVKVIKTDLNNDILPFENEFFDIILMEEVIEHLINPDNAFKEAYRILKKGGLFIVSTPNLAWWVNRLILLLGYQPYWSECSTVYNVGKFKRDLRRPISGHLRLYTYRALKQLLELYDFKVVASKGVTYSNLPFLFSYIDQIFSMIPSMAQIIIIIAQK
ncbi:MAG: class I SAM-dependent methyltransferase [Thermofilum sp.]|jgi:methionine biosynthesis protein MetW|uniref:class I SAM-dependent methyltransferase n=1 Tax=Thermofilum sp. TaxID=1961369 RepID=UPI0025908CFE|nr:class I SAM-dependent methyltransferase [Thermofilum sp.]MCI4407802.1 class I SAM-dependent methyltransferase [Thermofilum sp.]